MYVLALNGSHNHKGNTQFLLDEILAHCKEGGAEVETVNISDVMMKQKLPFCVSCSSPCSMQCYKGTALEETFEKVKRADFVIFGSPVYFGSMTAQMKAFFDKTRAPRAQKAWLGKPCACVSVGASKYGGQERTVEHMQACALVSGMTAAGNSSQIGMGHFGVSAQKPANEDTYAIAQCKSMAQRILEMCK